MAAITQQTPWYTGQTFPSITIPLNTDSGQDNITGLTPSNFTVIIKNLDKPTLPDITGTGTVVIANVNPASITYTFNGADVQTSGNCQIQVEAVFPNGGLAIYDPIPFYIKAV